MLNNKVPEPSASALKKKDDDWLNAGVEEVPASVYKQQDDDWLNAEDNQFLETVDESSLDQATTYRPDIQIRQEGSILDIAVIASKKQDITSEQAVIHLKIILPPQVLARKGEGLYDIEITPDDSSPSSQSSQDVITAKPAEELDIQSYALLDEITVRPAESLVVINPQLKDEISIRPVENQIIESQALMDEIYIKPAERPVNQIHALMDEITVKPVESPVIISSQLLDEVSIKPAENQVSESHGLMDEITIIPSPGPVKIEYDLVDDLITKSALYRPKKEKPPVDAIVTNPVENPVAKAEPVKPISIHEITKILEEKRRFKPIPIPSIATELRITPFLTRKSEGIVNLPGQAKSLYKRTGLRVILTRALAILRVYNKYGFYIQDTDLTQVDIWTPEPQIKDFTLKVVNTVTELDELMDSGYDLVMNISQIKRGLKKGMVAFLIFVEKELASMGWACLTDESKATLRGYPYNDDLDGQACIVGGWTNPKFRDSGISRYIQHQRQQLIKEKGFTFERRMVEEGVVPDLGSMTAHKSLELTYKRRTYTNISLPGILGVEFWKEHSLNETNTKRPYQLITLSFLLLPSPPRKVAALNMKLRF